MITTLMFTLFASRFAYIEFTDKESVDNAVTMDDSLFKGRQIKVHHQIGHQLIKMLKMQILFIVVMQLVS